MASLKWDFHNWVTVLLMVGVAYVAFGLARSVIMGAGGTTAEA